MQPRRDKYALSGSFLPEPLISIHQMFQAWEEWDFVTATYFSFITLTTVGFGDYTPDNSMKNALKTGATFSDWVQMILCLVYLMFGK